MEGDDGVERSQRVVKASDGPVSKGRVSDGRVSDRHSRGQKRVCYKTKETLRENKSHSRSHSSAGDQRPAPSSIHSTLGQVSVTHVLTEAERPCSELKRQFCSEKGTCITNSGGCKMIRLVANLSDSSSVLLFVPLILTTY